MSEEDKMDYGELSFADDLVRAGDVKISWVKMLIYGPSGAGKTSAIATMPDPFLAMVTEKQAELAIKRVNPNAIIRYIEDKVICRCHGKDANKCRDGAKKGTEKLTAKQVLYSMLDELATKKHPFVSVGLDSLTDLQKVLLSDMKGGVIGKKMPLDQWGVLIELTQDVVIKLRNLNMHVGVICLSDEAQDNNQRMICRPALMGKKLPSSLIQYFNLCGYQQKTRDAGSAHASYETVFDAGNEFFTKTHPALEAIEAPLFRGWVDKITKYALEHGEGDMPSASAPVQQAVQEKKQGDLLKERINQKKISDLFDQLNAPEAKRLATAEKYRSDAKLIEILEKRVIEAKAVEDKVASEKAAADAAAQAQAPSDDKLMHAAGRPEPEIQA